jgi:hypothetical protein
LIWSAWNCDGEQIQTASTSGSVITSIASDVNFGTPKVLAAATKGGVQRLLRFVNLVSHDVSMPATFSLTRLGFWYSRVRDYDGNDTWSLVDCTQVHDADTPAADHADFDRALRPSGGSHLKSRCTGSMTWSRGKCRCRLDGHQANKNWAEPGHCEFYLGVEMIGNRNWTYCFVLIVLVRCSGVGKK